MQKNRKALIKETLIYVISFVILGLAVVHKLQIVFIFVSLFLIFFHFPEMRDIGSIVANLGKGFEELKYGRFSAKMRNPADETAIEIKTTPPSAEDDDSPVNLFNEGNKLLITGDPLSAIEKYDEAIRIRSNFSDAYLNKGAAYLALWHKTGDEEYRTESIASSGASLDLASDGYRSRINLAVAYSKDPEKMPEALELYDEADARGSTEDPLTWGKVKLFKGKLLLRLSTGPEGEAYQTRLPEAAEAVRLSLDLFKLVRHMPETSRWITEAKATLDSIKANLKKNGSTKEAD